ncbi:MAG: ATP-binding cassette domain-containing protein [Pseudomonadota bacterium]
MLEARKVSYGFGPGFPPVLEDVSIQVGPGEVVGLHGPSGRGKTTLARLLSGYLQPDRGEVLLDGQSLPARGFHPVQLLYQHPELAVNPRWKISRVLNEGASPPPRLLDALQISWTWLDRYPHELSGGELQRVCVARALGPGTRFVIADEMTSMLDAMTQVRIWKTLLEEARRREIGVLAVSHNRDLLARVCDRIEDQLAGKG